MTCNRPRQLPTMRHKGKLYFIDLRLRELRTVLPPLEFVPFDSELGREIDEMPDPEEDECLTGYSTVVICPYCSAILFEGKESEAKRLIIYCIDCAERS